MNVDINEICIEFRDKIKQFILKRISNEYDAEDILQEVFIKIHSKIGILRDKNKINSWIYTIARNTIIDFYRSQKPTLELSNSLLETLSVSKDSIPSNAIEELNQCVKILVNYLPLKYREAILLTEYQGMTIKKMGEKLGLSLSGAKSRVRRARIMLKKMLLQGCHYQLENSGIIVNYQSKCECCTKSKSS